MRAGDDTICAGIKGLARAFLNQIADLSVFDQGPIQILTIQRRQDGDRKDLKVFVRGTLFGSFHHIGVAMHRQEIQIELCQAPDCVFHGRADVKELHVQKDALAVLGLELIGESKPTARQHAQSDFIK